MVCDSIFAFSLSSLFLRSLSLYSSSVHFVGKDTGMLNMSWLKRLSSCFTSSVARRETIDLSQVIAVGESFRKKYPAFRAG